MLCLRLGVEPYLLNWSKLWQADSAMAQSKSWQEYGGILVPEQVQRRSFVSMAETPDATGSPANRDAADVLRLMREARFASLATIDAETGGPYASLVNIALLASCSPVILISSLARHTHNLRANPAASLLIAEPSAAAGDPLASARVTLSGRFEQICDDTAAAVARNCFIASHPAAAGYADFRDFSWWTMSIDAAHLVAGFGRIRTIARAALLPDAVSG
jgi:putative heme iron utilization protein